MFRFNRNKKSVRVLLFIQLPFYNKTHSLPMGNIPKVISLFPKILLIFLRTTLYNSSRQPEKTAK